jgi:Glycosyl transferase family 2
MTINIRDEAAILEDNLRFHAAQGVDFFVVADHGSTDASWDLLDPYVEAGLVHRVAVEARDILDLHEQHMTRLAGTAAELGADWIIHNDADEFWWPVVGDLKDALASIPSEYGLLLAPRAEFPPQPGDEPWPERLCVRELRARHRPRLAHQPHPDLRLHGVHPANLWVEAPGGQSFSGPPKLRTKASVPGPEPAVKLVLAPHFPVRVLHFPIRSFEQYRHRIEIALAAPDTFGKRGRRLRRLRKEGRLAKAYEGLLFGAAEIETGLGEGGLVRDTDFRDYLRSCPDPLSGEPAPEGARAWSQDRRDRELAELELDAMASLSVRLQKLARDADPEIRRRRQQRRNTELESG